MHCKLAFKYPKFVRSYDKGVCDVLTGHKLRKLTNEDVCESPQIRQGLGRLLRLRIRFRIQ